MSFPGERGFESLRQQNVHFLIEGIIGVWLDPPCHGKGVVDTGASGFATLHASFGVCLVEGV
jgi:hypothetical protein